MTGPAETDTGETGTGGTGGDELELAEQLKALDDLEAEHRAGDLDEDDYRTLRDDYTVRVADVMRRIEGTKTTGATTGAATGVGSASRSTRRRLGPVALVMAVVFAAGAGWLLARAAGERGVNDGLTGEVASNRQRVFECQEMGAAGQIVESLQCFDEVLLVDPDNVEALTYRGWYVVLTTSSAEAAGQEEEAAELLEVGRTYLDRAVEVDPTFADARAFRTVIYDRLGQTEAVCSEVAALLELDPPAFFVQQTQAIANRNGC